MEGMKGKDEIIFPIFNLKRSWVFTIMWWFEENSRNPVGAFNK